MKAAIYPGGGQAIVIEDIPVPQPGLHEVLIKVHRCGICGTDLSMTRGGAMDFGSNVQFGHEYAGEVVEAGNAVTHLRPGDRVAVMPAAACGNCSSCRSHGNAVLCKAPTGPAMLGFAEYACVPADIATRLPDALSMADGALVEPLTISLYGAKLAAIQPGDPVLVLGGGTVALYAIYWARRLGAGRIVAMSRSAQRKDKCLAMGADVFLTFGGDEFGEVIEFLGGPPRIVLECVGAEGMLMKAISHVAEFGKIVSLGFCTAPDPVLPSIASFKCANMQFAVGYSMKEFRYAVDQLDKGHVDPKHLITKQISLPDLPSMMMRLREGSGETKVHVCM